MTRAAQSQSGPLLAHSVAPEELTFDEFLEWADEDTHAEWVNGKVVFMSPVSREHARVKKFLVKLLDYFVELHALGEIYDEPFQMKTGTNLPGRSPDIIFVAHENLGRLKDNYLDGPADLAVEVISPESRGRDRGEKFYEYEEGGVKEYWLIDPPRMQAEFHQLGPDRYFHLMALEPDGRFRSAVVPGFSMKVGWLWQRPLPTLPQVLREWSLS
ncbi:MAG: Uma2 family endonuclease [Verrucomicrobia bacterium]|nr:Uma2 family endonuclease [Verrucomicrobiota bacterium]